MAPAPKKSTDSTRTFLTPERKREILGICWMAVTFLVGLSILTYNEADHGILTDTDLGDLFIPTDGSAARIRNGLGVVGAWLAHGFVYVGFGYAALLLPLLAFRYGWALFRHKPLKDLGWTTGYGLVAMVLASTVLGWFDNVLTTVEFPAWSGAAGLTLAGVLISLTARIGSALILLVAVAVMALLVVDRDIQATVDRVRDWLERLKERRAAAKDATAAAPDPVPAKASGPRLRALKEEPAIAEAAPWEAPPAPAPPPPKPDPVVMPARAILEDPPMQVFVGEEEEQAGSRDLERAQKLEALPTIRYRFPTIDLLDNPPAEGNEVDMDEIEHTKAIILDKLGRHGIDILSIDAIVGPTVTLYELNPAPDVKISRIESYANDLKMAMAAHGIRIIAPIPGKSAVGIEVPNRKRETVYIKQLINTKKFVETKMHLPVAFGKTIENEVYMVDLTTLPHLLIAGATGSGKSVGINTIITCLLYKCHPENLKFVMVDPKKIELSLYRHLQNHFLATLPDADEPIITDTAKVMETLLSVTKEMDERYDLLKMAQVRDIRAYNDKFKSGALESDLGHRHLPYIVVIIDELADLMLTAGKAIEEPIARIAQLARAVGIHAVVATQRPSVNVITGTIKANFPVRIAYQVASKIDSRTILDTSGADQLVGRGDMLVSGGGRMTRVQNAFVSTEEVERINAFIGNQLGYDRPYHLPKIEDPDAPETTVVDAGDRDDLFEEAAKVVVLHQQGSVSLIQRKLKLGYNRAGRLIDQLYAAGIVGPYSGSTARDVLIPDEDALYEHLRNLDDEDA